MGYYDSYGWKPYVPVAERRRKAEREMQRLEQQGQRVSPVVLEGRAIARTFWGKAWCDNLERYSDFASRLPRGRTYVRNGSVLDLQIAPGEVRALVSGSDLYKVAVKVAPVPQAQWAAICGDCAGAIDSLVELLQGRFSKGVMERICQQQTGLFPAPAAIGLSCSCPDWASMCKHVAAVLYGVGARLDEQPELLFKLRQVDEGELIASAGNGLPLSPRAIAAEKILPAGELAELFGLELGLSSAEPVAETTAALDEQTGKKKTRAKTETRKKTAKARARVKTTAKARVTKTTAKTTTRAKPRTKKRAAAQRVKP